jgi:tetratricopeptide (TPR) repeat protein
LDGFLRIEEVINIKACADYYPKNDLAYAKKGVELLKEAAKIQPLYTRFWLYLGSFTTIIADNEQDPIIKESLIKEIYSYFDRAEALSPLHTEILIERTKADMVAGDYRKAEQNAQKCIDIKPDVGDCYWIKALAELYLKDDDLANKNIAIAAKLGFSDSPTNAFYRLIGVYEKTKQYDKLAGIYEKLIIKNPDFSKFHSFLAFAYSKLGEYKKVREQAIIFLEMIPEAENEVDAFLKTLPY